MAIREAPIWPLSGMPIHHAYRTASVYLNIHQESGDLVLIPLPDSSSYSKQVKIRVTLNMEVD
ncbi:Uncharacterized protein KF715C_ch38590 [Pseudomonas putida]|uniref:Uncharacterized protein n=1 Tax=Pseudomonas putida TaxID=303 RepID=A0A1L7NG93_PSEPU|nr:Uncharacterized protein KF715C_ch38590 [Pseudomonas putida]